MTDRIVLDRNQLKRLTTLLKDNVPSVLKAQSPELQRGYELALDIVEAIAEEMPDLQEPVRTYPEGHRNPDESGLTLYLDDYQLANLTRLINAVYLSDSRPVKAFNTGDWVGEIFWLISNQTNTKANPIAGYTALDSWLEHIILCGKCNRGADPCDDGMPLMIAAREERDGA